MNDPECPSASIQHLAVVKIHNLQQFVRATEAIQHTTKAAEIKGDIIASVRPSKVGLR